VSDGGGRRAARASRNGIFAALERLGENEDNRERERKRDGERLERFFGGWCGG